MKLPVPSPRRTVTLLLNWLTVTMSGIPSAFMSWTRSCVVPVPSTDMYTGLARLPPPKLRMSATWLDPWQATSTDGKAPVEVVSDHDARGLRVLVERDRLERLGEVAGAVADEDLDVVRRPVAEDHVEPAVAVDVAERDALRLDARGRCRERRVIERAEVDRHALVEAGHEAHVARRRRARRRLVVEADHGRHPVEDQAREPDNVRGLGEVVRRGLGLVVGRDGEGPITVSEENAELAALEVGDDHVEAAVEVHVADDDRREVRRVAAGRVVDVRDGVARGRDERAGAVTEHDRDRARAGRGAEVGGHDVE